MLRFRRCQELVLGLPTGELLEAVEARGPAARLLGLALLRRPPRRALLLPRCRSVHTWGMRFAIDVVFLTPVAGGAGLRVMALHPRLGPRRVVSRRADGQLGVLEVPAGDAARLGLRPGRLLPVLGRKAR